MESGIHTPTATTQPFPLPSPPFPFLFNGVWGWSIKQTKKPEKILTAAFHLLKYFSIVYECRGVSNSNAPDLVHLRASSSHGIH